MCGPAAAVAGIAVLGAGLAFGKQDAANQANEYNARVAENNARVADIQASQAVERGRISSVQSRLQTKRLIGQQRSAFGASGALVDEGSSLDAVLDTASFGEVDALTIQYNADIEAFGHKAKASSFRSTAAINRASNVSPFAAAGGSLLSSAARVAPIYLQKKKVG